jgi:RNA-directed DNA polymerase
MAKVKAQCRKTGTDLPFDTLLICLNRMLRGWCELSRVS